MSALFSTSTCNFGTDTIVNSVVWNNVDQIAAMSSNTMDENDNETNNVHFMNNEVSINFIFIFLRHYSSTYATTYIFREY